MNQHYLPRFLLAGFGLLALGSCSDAGPTDPPDAAVCVGSTSSAALNPAPHVPLDSAFARAERDFGVPASLLKAIGYVETRWQMVEGFPEFGQPKVYGLMGLKAGQLEQGAALAGVSTEAARTEPEANIRSSAALLHAYSKELKLTPLTLGAWAPVVARYSAIELTAGQTSYVHDDVYAVLRRGASTAVATLEPSKTDLRPEFALPRRNLSGSADRPDYAPSLWRPSPNVNQRPGGDIGKVAMVIIHSCEGNYTGCWSWLVNPQSGVSAHYVVREDGSEISQLVHESDRGWHIGSSYDCNLNANADCWRNGVSNNHFTVGIEHGGFAAQTSWPTAQIDASAKLVCDITRRQGIPRDRIHILAHAQLQPHNRTDPGPNWPWADYLARINRYCDGGPGTSAIIVDSNNSGNNAALGSISVSPAWTATSATPGYFGTGYYFASTSSTDADPATFRFFLAEAGTRTIDAWWTEGSNRSPKTPFIVSDAAGAQLAAVEVNQQRDGGRWYTLGTWAFPAGWNTVQVSRRSIPGCVVVADAIQVR